MAFEKPIKEQGIILSKHINEAREAGGNKDFQWAARPKEFVIVAISCDEDEFDPKDCGFVNPTYTEYKVEEDLYNKAHYGMRVNVKYVLKNGEKSLVTRGVSLTLIDEKK